MSGVDAEGALCVSIVIKNADGVTSDFALRDTPLLGTRMRSLKTMLREQYPGQPEEDSMKLVHSGRLLKDNELLSDVIQLQDLSVPPIFHLLVREGPRSATSSTPVSRSNSNVSELSSTPMFNQPETPGRSMSFDRSYSSLSNTSVNQPATPSAPSPAVSALSPIASSAPSPAGFARSPIVSAPSSTASMVATSGSAQHQNGCCHHHHHAHATPSSASAASGTPANVAAIPAPPSVAGVATASQAWSSLSSTPIAAIPAWPASPAVALPAYPPLPMGMGMQFGGTPDPAACYEMLHRIYYEAYYATYMAALESEEAATPAPSACCGVGAGASCLPGAAAVDTPQLERARAMQVPPATAMSFGSGAAAQEAPADMGGAAYDAGDGRIADAGADVPQGVHLHAALAGARGPARQALVRDEADGGRGAGGREGGGAVRLAAKLIFIVFLLGQDAPKERLYTLCCIAVCIFLHQIGLLQPPAWLQPRPPVGGMGGMGDVRGDEGDNADDAGNEGQDGDASGGGGGRRGGGGPPAVEDRGLLGDVAALVVAFFTSLFPVPLGHEPGHGLAN